MADEREERLSRLYDDHYHRILGMVRNMGLTPSEAQDTAQDTFVSVYKNMERVEADAAYLYKTARNKALNVIRDRSVADRYLPKASPDDLIEAPDKGDSPEERLLRKEQARIRAERLCTAMTELPLKTQDVLAQWIAGFKYREIASRSGLTLDSVKSRLREAKQRLREILGEEVEGDGEDDDDHES